MLTLRSLLSLPIFLSSSLMAHALAPPTRVLALEQKDVSPTLATQLTGGEDCQSEQLQRIRDGFSEMNQLFQAAVNPDWDGDPERDFFGPKERIQNFTELIEANLLRAGNATQNPDIHVRCDDPNDLCDEGSKREGRHVAYNIGNEPHINFCRRYFGLDPLEKTVDDVAGNASVNMELMNYYNRATAWARQVMHFSAVGTAIVEKMETSQQINDSSYTTAMHNAAMNTSFLAGVRNERPETDGPNDIEALKYAYGATRAKLLAIFSTQEPYDTANNAESYALYAQARYIIARKSMYPNMPVIEFSSEASLLANNDLQEGEKGQKRYACFEDMDVAPRNERTNPLTSSGSTIAMAAVRCSNLHVGAFGAFFSFLVLSFLI